MQIILTVIQGPHIGQVFVFDRHEHFLVGRAKHSHFQLPEKDPYFSRLHFMIEVNPPACRLLDLGSTNGTSVNGQAVTTVDLRHGDLIEAGDTTLRVTIQDRATEDLTATAVKSPSGPESISTQLFPESLEAVLRSPPEREPLERDEWSPPGYQLRECLGSGGMGIVYRARRVSDDRDVAIKVLQPSIAGAPGETERFLREISILRQIDHPSIIRLWDAGEFAGRIYFAMELMPGDTAKTWVERETEPLKVAVAVGIALRVAEGLHHAHQQGFVHRDVKPGNILLRRSEGKLHVKLADFGLARAYQASQLSGLTLTGDLCGTPRYMAPEQITDARNALPATDQYATAATLYWLLTKRHTHEFVGEIQRDLHKIMLEAPRPIVQHRPDLPPRLAWLVQRALSRDPAARYPDMRVFADALRESLSMV
jgi:serine/threonine-protein kinase